MTQEELEEAVKQLPVFGQYGVSITFARTPGALSGLRILKSLHIDGRLHIDQSNLAGIDQALHTGERKLAAGQITVWGMSGVLYGDKTKVSMAKLRSMAKHIDRIDSLGPRLDFIKMIPLATRKAAFDEFVTRLNESRVARILQEWGCEIICRITDRDTGFPRLFVYIQECSPKRRVTHLIVSCWSGVIYNSEGRDTKLIYDTFGGFQQVIEAKFMESLEKA